MKPAEPTVVPKIRKLAQQQEEEEEDDGTIPENATETLYLQNLNEKVQVKGELLGRYAGMSLTLLVMKQSLALLFKSYKPLLPIIMHGNIRMRGQAFVSFPDVETANRARKEVSRFPLYGRPMVRCLVRQIMLTVSNCRLQRREQTR